MWLCNQALLDDLKLLACGLVLVQAPLSCQLVLGLYLASPFHHVLHVCEPICVICFCLLFPLMPAETRVRRRAQHPAPSRLIQCPAAYHLSVPRLLLAPLLQVIEVRLCPLHPHFQMCVSFVQPWPCVVERCLYDCWVEKLAAVGPLVADYPTLGFC